MTTIGERSGGGGVSRADMDRGSGRVEDGGISRRGNVITVGNYEITIEKDRMVVRDTTTGKEFSVWGDPHLHTGDGDRASFTEDNLTIDLPGGVKITLTPTEKDANGASWIDEIGIMMGDEGILISDVHNAPTFGEVEDSASVDEAHEDGTVLTAGEEIDDLRDSDGNELVGGDANGRWGEHDLDGRGGISENDFSDIEAASGDKYDRLYAVLARLERMKDGQIEHLESLLKRKENKEKAGNKLYELQQKGPEDKDRDGSISKEERDAFNKEVNDLKASIDHLGENLETELQRAQLELQRTQSLISQTTNLLTNLVATDGQNALAIIRNIRAG